MYINKSKIIKRVKELNPNIKRVSSGFIAGLNLKLDEIITNASKRNGSHKTITETELMNGSQFGVKPRK